MLMGTFQNSVELQLLRLTRFSKVLREHVDIIYDGGQMTGKT